MRVRGAVIPLNVKPVPLIATCEIATLEPPVFVTVSVRVALCPTVTLPKPREDELGPRVPTAVVPAPDKGMLNAVSDASEVIVTLPFEVPVAVGANSTLKPAVCPAASVTGAVIPLKVNAVPTIPT